MKKAINWNIPLTNIALDVITYLKDTTKLVHWEISKNHKMGGNEVDAILVNLINYRASLWWIDLGLYAEDLWVESVTNK